MRPTLDILDKDGLSAVSVSLDAHGRPQITVVDSQAQGFERARSGGEVERALLAYLIVRAKEVADDEKSSHNKQGRK